MAKYTEDFIDKNKFEICVQGGLSDQEICDFFMVKMQSLLGWIKVVYKTNHPLMYIKKLRATAKLQFNLEQRKVAKNNPTLSIWVGKNQFGQTDGTEKSESADIEDLSPLVKLLAISKPGDNN